MAQGSTCLEISQEILMLLVKGSWLDGFLTGLFVFFFNFSKMKTSPFLARSFRTSHSDYKKKKMFFIMIRVMLISVLFLCKIIFSL